MVEILIKITWVSRNGQIKTLNIMSRKGISYGRSVGAGFFKPAQTDTIYYRGSVDGAFLLGNIFSSARIKMASDNASV